MDDDDWDCDLHLPHDTEAGKVEAPRLPQSKSLTTSKEALQQEAVG